MAAENLSNWTPDYVLSHEYECQQILSNLENRKSVPCLNDLPLHAFKDKQLVRFRGMVQDTFNPEYYVESFKIQNRNTKEIQTCYGKYREILNFADNENEIIYSDENTRAERKLCYVVTIPCLNSWVKEKRSIPEEEILQPSNSGLKRRLNSESMEYEESSSKKLTQNIPERTETRPYVLSKERILNFPVPNEDGKACIVKIYRDMSLTLNQIIDVVGFISLDPALNIDSELMIDDVEFQSHNPPPSLIPRLHAIDVKENFRDEFVALSNDLSNPENIRADLKLILSQILFGDTLAAEYLICHLISSVYVRQDILFLGNFPLNITNFSVEKCATFTKDLYEILALLLPKSHLFEITLYELNHLELIPKKDYECNRLTSGMLQLSENTHLVLDETNLTTGQVSSHGKKNYDAFSTLLNYQKVNYDFNFFTVDFETDIPVLILSETKSMIPCERQIILEKNQESERLYTETLEATREYLRDESKLTNIRNYLRVARHRPIEIDDTMNDIIQEEFVKMRRSDNSTTPEDLQSLMVLARLITLSHEGERMTVEHWTKAVTMEIERKSRLRSRRK